MQHLLRDIYGDEWPQVINERYQKVEYEMQSKAAKKFENIGNDQERRVAAGFADHPNLFKLMGKDVKGHEKKYERNFDRLHAKFFEENNLPDEEQICSEWATKATLVAMLETNKRIASEIRKKVGNQFDGNQILQNLQQRKIDLPADVEEYLKGIRHWKEQAAVSKQAERKLVKILKDQRYSAQDIQLIIRLGNQEIFDLPYSQKERLKAVHPGRMVRLLTDKKCAKIKEPPTILRNLVAI